MATYDQSGRVPDDQNLFLLGCNEVDQWFLMGSPWPTLLIVATYLMFVIKIGPAFMKDRKPLQIKWIMLLYNLYQTISNALLVSKLFTTKGATTYLWKHCCHPMDPAVNPYWTVLNQNAWLYFFSKIMDLLDTVFFILRKKQSHVTFLHVYHHANMVLSTWAYLKYIKGEQGVLIGIINSSVHVVMYGYYFIAALGPEFQKYLWWKKYITRMQMTQFVIIIVYMASLLIANCDLPKALSLYAILQGIIFFVLFANFYIKTYIGKSNTNVKPNPKTSHSMSNGITSKGITSKGITSNGIIHNKMEKVKQN